jgi:predicted Zn-dependent protease
LRRPSLLAILSVLACGGIAAALAGRYARLDYRRRAGLAELERHHAAAACEHLRDCVEARPDRPALRLLAARAARQSGNLAVAQQQLDEYRRLGGQSGDDEFVRESALLRAQGGDPDAVMSYCQHLVERTDRAAPLALEAMIVGYLQTFRTEDAEFCADIWLDRQPDDTQALYLKGLIRERYDDFEGAEKFHRRAITLDPEHDDACLHLGDCLVEISRPGEAEGYLTALRRRRPHDPAVLVSLARCQNTLGRAGEAAALLDEVLARAPKYLPALAARGQLALQEGDLRVAQRCLRTATDVAPGDYQAHFLLHQALVRANKGDEARAEEHRLKQVKKDNDRLREIFKEMRRSPDDVDLRYEVGRILLSGGAPREGLHWLQGVLEKAPRHQATHALLADYYRRTGNLGRAEHHGRLAGEARPSEPSPTPRSEGGSP